MVTSVDEGELVPLAGLEVDEQVGAVVPEMRRHLRTHQLRLRRLHHCKQGSKFKIPRKNPDQSTEY